MTPRPYRDDADWQAMMALLQAGRRANNGTYYVHTGDVRWWLFYPNDQAANFPKRIFLWEDGSGLLGWCLVSPNTRAYDVFVAPHMRGTPLAEEMEQWAEARLTEQVTAEADKPIQVDWISDKDTIRIASLERRGFKSNPELSLNYYQQPLVELPHLDVPDGYRLDHVHNDEDAQPRALASQLAFKSRFDWEAYWPRYQSFVHSAAYVPEHDRTLVAPDGRCASFCVYWLDEANKIGLFEPVGTHPDFQGRGLGKVLLNDALHRMKAEGMQRASVCAVVDNPAANRLYQSVGFIQRDTFLLFEKNL